MDVCNLMKKTGDNYTEFDVVMFNVKMMDTVARPRVKTLLKQTISSENLCCLITNTNAAILLVACMCCRGRHGRILIY